MVTIPSTLTVTITGRTTPPIPPSLRASSRRPATNPTAVGFREPRSRQFELNPLDRLWVVRAHNPCIRNISTPVNQLSRVLSHTLAMPKMRYNHPEIELGVVVEGSSPGEGSKLYYNLD